MILIEEDVLGSWTVNLRCRRVGLLLLDHGMENQRHGIAGTGQICFGEYSVVVEVGAETLGRLEECLGRWAPALTA